MHALQIIQTLYQDCSFLIIIQAVNFFMLLFEFEKKYFSGLWNDLIKINANQVLFLDHFQNMHIPTENVSVETFSEKKWL